MSKFIHFDPFVRLFYRSTIIIIAMHHRRQHHHRRRRFNLSSSPSSSSSTSSSSSSSIIILVIIIVKSSSSMSSSSSSSSQHNRLCRRHHNRNRQVIVIVVINIIINKCIIVNIITSKNSCRIDHGISKINREIVPSSGIENYRQMPVGRLSQFKCVEHTTDQQPLIVDSTVPRLHRPATETKYYSRYNVEGP